MMGSLHTAAEGAAQVASGVAVQAAHVLFAAGSTFSLPMLAVTLAAFVLLSLPRGRDLKWKVVRRVVLPRRLLGTASGRTDIAYAVAGVSVLGLAIGWSLVSAEAVRGFVLDAIGPAPAARLPGWASQAISTIVLFVAFEFAYWLDHRMKHAVPVLWHFHKVHHQAEHLSILTDFRVHPVDTLIFLNLAAVVLGTTQALLATALGGTAGPLAVGGTNLLVMVTAVGLSHLQHSHLWITFGPRWGRWLLGPAHHQVHHSAEPRHCDRNFGDVLAIFDRLFGTFWMPAPRREVTRFGVDGSAAPHGWRGALLQPFADAAHEALRPIALGNAAARPHEMPDASPAPAPASASPSRLRT